MVPVEESSDAVSRRNLIVLAGAQIVTISAMAIVLPFIPFFVRELGVTDRASVERWSGLIFSGPFLAAALMSPVWGYLGDRFGHKPMVVRACVGLAVVNFLLFFVQTPLQFYLVRLAQGLVTGFIPAALALISASTPPSRLADAMGRLQASASAGRLVGPAIGGLLAGFLPFRMIFVLVGSLIALATVGLVLFLKEPPRDRIPPRTSPLENLRFVFEDARIRTGLLGLLVSMAGVSMVMPIFPLYVEDLLAGGGNPSIWTGIGFATVAAATMVAATFAGRISRRIGLKRTLLSGLMITTVALAAHPFATDLPQMLAARILLGVGVAGAQPILIAMVARRAPQGRAGGVTGFASAATILGFFVGPFTGGLLANFLGVSGVFWVAAGITFLCFLLAAIVVQRLGRSRELLPMPTPLPR